MSNNQTMREALQIALSAIRNTPEMYRSNYALEFGEQALAAELAEETQPVAWTTMPDSEDWVFLSGSRNPNGNLEGVWHPLYTHPNPKAVQLDYMQWCEIGHQYGVSGVAAEAIFKDALAGMG